MLDDFHYYCTAVLAKAAGFTANDALTIAYASQYVDDATENRPVKVGEMFFDPTRTAYFGLRSLNWPIQKRIYLPFHFLPSKPIMTHEDDFKTRSDSIFSRALLDEAASDADDKIRLYRIGIAAHTYADTFAHLNFSGRYHLENSVREVEALEDNEWIGLGWKKPLYRLGPTIGHAEAGLLPDIPYIKWRYIQRINGNLIERDNISLYIEAANKIYKYFRKVKKKHKTRHIPWRKIENSIGDCLSFPSGSLDERCEKWIDVFGYLFVNHKYKYNKYRWRKKALGVHRSQIEWDDKPRLLYFSRQKYPMTKHFYDSDWVLFHRAAMRQRHFVLQNLI